jgi:hypothetical protein
MKIPMDPADETFFRRAACMPQSASESKITKLGFSRSISSNEKGKRRMLSSSINTLTLTRLCMRSASSASDVLELG